MASPPRSEAPTGIPGRSSITGPHAGPDRAA